MARQEVASLIGEQEDEVPHRLADVGGFLWRRVSAGGVVFEYGIHIYTQHTHTQTRRQRHTNTDLKTDTARTRTRTCTHHTQVTNKSGIYGVVYIVLLLKRLA